MTMIAIQDSSRSEASAFADLVVDEAVRQAEERGWQAVRLSEVARNLELPMSVVLERFRDMDAVANAWFQRGWRAMLAEKPETFDDWPERVRIEHCLQAWFDTFAAHRRVTVQMLRTKAHLPHPHTWVPLVFDLSRTVQWLREAARLEARYGTRRAQLEEVALTSLFVAALAVWARDTSEGQRKTRHFIDKRLKRGESWMRWVPSGAKGRHKAEAQL
ncbi:TetR family transcriptional regulator [Billgrantia desiderata]|uniref:TetR/AcrR family transcriptional regulator n=1 Tax=Billgrantia desiderata TaxID=52021 RepID=A0AAW4YVB5_9GAMM|nr:TetR family transcriptional regulator [Halomonas desiderata]MCE8043179.1 TetR/AcrR family transcriptional regulator [Halomonas desiderata]MCE8047724.1 TetR/AcrR family transcriptional regulator [Halomonas desiderata]MCE8052310.1 TetR/AcrR family transcriptional regulator [Halomonas desiderata]SEG02023.1 transcriptional regulator, TetR family [Halomonas desiderata]